MSENSVCAASFDGLAQHIQRLYKDGFVYVCVTEYPLHKKDKWDAIDRKLIEKYPVLSKTKSQRTSRRAKGLLTAMILRWDRYCVILCTDGRDDCGLHEREEFVHLKSRPIVIQVSPSLRFKVGVRDHKCTVSFEDQCFRDLKAYYIAQAQMGRLNMVQAEFRGLDRVAMSYSGLFAQKRAIQKAIIKAARAAGHYWTASQFPVALKRMSMPYGRPKERKSGAATNEAVITG